MEQVCAAAGAPPAAAKKAPAAAASPKPARTPKPAAKSTKPAKKLSEGYTLDGTPPAGCDVPAVEALLAERVAAKIRKDYATADALQERLLEMGVFCNDRLRTWSGEAPAKKA